MDSPLVDPKIRALAGCKEVDALVCARAPHWLFWKA